MYSLIPQFPSKRFQTTLESERVIFRFSPPPAITVIYGYDSVRLLCIVLLSRRNNTYDSHNTLQQYYANRARGKNDLGEFKKFVGISSTLRGV